MMATNLFVIANGKQLRTGGSFRTLLPFFRTSWSVGVLNSAVFNSFHNRVEFGTILEGFRNFGGVEHPNPPPLGTPLSSMDPQISRVRTRSVVHAECTPNQQTATEWNDCQGVKRERQGGSVRNKRQRLMMYENIVTVARQQ